jgi:hypothetical protein
MKYLQYAVLQVIAAIAIYLALFLVGKALPYIGGLLVIAAIAYILYRKHRDHTGGKRNER